MSGPDLRCRTGTRGPHSRSCRRRRTDGGGIVGVVGTDVLASASIDCRSASEGEQRQERGGNDDEANHDVVKYNG